MGSTGAFSNQFIEGIKPLYEIEPLIKVKLYLTNQWEKSGLVGKPSLVSRKILVSSLPITPLAEIDSRRYTARLSKSVTFLKGNLVYTKVSIKEAVKPIG